MEEQTSRKSCLLALSVSAVLLSVAALIIIAALYVVTLKIPDMYAVVLDAGSTSTKLNLYKWRDEPFRSNGEVVLVKEMKAQPGISDYIDKPIKAYDSFASKLKNLTSGIFENQKSNVPVYLAATAGMRLQLLVSPLESLTLLENIRRGLKTSGLYVETPNERIRLLSGAEEGLYGWVSVNYILELLTAKKQVKSSETVGSLDLGGASTQISFAPSTKPTDLEQSIDFFPLKLYGKTYNVYSHSYLCFGKDEIENRIIAAVYEKSKSVIDYPCFLSGYLSEEKDVSKIFRSPCVTGKYAVKVFGSELTPSLMSEKFKLKGTGSATECESSINDLFVRLYWDAVYKPDMRGQFRAYSGFSYVMEYLFPNKTSGFTANIIREKVIDFCKKQWDMTLAESKAEKFCFDGFVLLAILKNFGFDTDEEMQQITFGKYITGQLVSWALGYTLDESGHLPSESPGVHMPLNLFAPLAIVFILFFIASVVSIVLLLLKNK